MYKYRCVRVILLVWFHFCWFGILMFERLGGQHVLCNSDSNVVCIMRRRCGLRWGVKDRVFERLLGGQ